MGCLLCLALAVACRGRAGSRPPTARRPSSRSSTATRSTSTSAAAPSTVRLIGIDTPEVFVDAGEEPECFGPEASAFTAELLPPGTVVRLVRDVVGRDDYDRLLAYVRRADDGRLVNLALVEHGFAAPLSIPPNTAYAARFVAAATAAEAAGVGLWGACGG